MHRGLRAELQDAGINVVEVYPDYTTTPLFENEKRVGTAVRPPGPYRPVQDVASSIVSAIRSGKQELILSSRGRALRVARSIAPGLSHWFL